MTFAYGLGNTTIFLRKKDYDGKFKQADFIEKFRMERSDPIFHRVSVMEVPISSMVSKTFREALFPE